MPQRERPLCEGCGAQKPTFGTPLERERRWCGGCGKAQGAISLAAKMCHGCGAKEATFGTPTERKRRWCGGCGKAHGAISLLVVVAKMCQGCGVKRATFGTPTERERRWCGGCGKAHGAINLSVPVCVVCDVRSSSTCGWVQGRAHCRQCALDVRRAEAARDPKKCEQRTVNAELAYDELNRDTLVRTPHCVSPLLLLRALRYLCCTDRVVLRR